MRRCAAPNSAFAAMRRFKFRLCGDAPLQVPPFKTIVIFSTSTYGGYKRYCRVRVITIYRRHSIHRIRRNKLYNLTPPFLYPLPTADISKGGIVCGDPPQAELSAATRHRRNCLRRYATGGIVCGDTPHCPFFRTWNVLLYVHKINKPTEKGNSNGIFNSIPYYSTVLMPYRRGTATVRDRQNQNGSCPKDKSRL